ncbi:MAG: hypothetical protein ACXADO_05505, partial [Candidatus Thorarchaeota archaeon]
VFTPESSMALADTNLIVTDEVANLDGHYDDDDFIFHAYNYTHIIGNANVSLYFTNDTLYDSKLTSPSDGKIEFFDVPKNTYLWNVSLETALVGFDPTEWTSGTIVADGPDATASVQIGNIDWEDDDDDFTATVLDIEGDPAVGLNFTIIFRDNSSLYSQAILGANGSVMLWDVPMENYTWQVIVPSGDYLGEVITEGDFESNGTQRFFLSTLGQIIGASELYDLEIFAYMETSHASIAGVLVNVTYHNGTQIIAQTTPANGTLLVVDLPIAYINVSITFGGDHIGASPLSFNLTELAYDISFPRVTGPESLDILYGATNVTLTWNLEDEYPSEFAVRVNGEVKASQTWNVTPYEYTFNLTAAIPDLDIGLYDVTMSAQDQNLQSTSHTVNVRVFENVTPVVEGPEDTEFYFTETGHTLSWNVTDEFPDNYIITRNGEDFASGEVNPDSPVVTVGLEGLAIGQHIFTFLVYDTSGNNATDDVVVTVKGDDVVPVITYAPADFQVSQGLATVIRNWTATDDFKAEYTIVVDGITVVESDWNSETIEFDFSSLSVGVHEVVLTVYDIGGNSATSTVTVSVTISEAFALIVLTGVVVASVIVIGLLVWFVRYR